MAQTSTSEMVGATQAPVTLARERNTAHVALTAPTGPAARATGAPRRRRAYLNLEHITSGGVPSSYAIYLNLPDGADPEQNRHLFAGLLPAFGVAEASRRDEHSDGSGLNHALDVTDIVDWLQANNQWDPSHLHVTFVPRGKNAGEVPVQVGRTSLYYK
jgi:tyrosinase